MPYSIGFAFGRVACCGAMLHSEAMLRGESIVRSNPVMHSDAVMPRTANVRRMMVTPSGAAKKIAKARCRLSKSWRRVSIVASNQRLLKSPSTKPCIESRNELSDESPNKWD